MSVDERGLLSLVSLMLAYPLGIYGQRVAMQGHRVLGHGLSAFALLQFACAELFLLLGG